MDTESNLRSRLEVSASKAKRDEQRIKDLERALRDKERRICDLEVELRKTKISAIGYPTVF